MSARLLPLVLIVSACGRNEVFFPPPGPPPAICALDITPSRLDFGSVIPGNSATKDVFLTDTGQAACKVTSATLAPGTDRGFTLTPPSAEVDANTALTVAVTFAPSGSETSGTKTGMLVIGTLDPLHLVINIPLTAAIPVGCVLTAGPATVDFGLVPLFTSGSAGVDLLSSGDEPCTITSVALDPMTDPMFSIVDLASLPITLPPTQSLGIPLAFDASSPNAPHVRTGMLDVRVQGTPAADGNPPPTATVQIPLKAETPLGCSLSYQPSLSFGALGLNQTLTLPATIENVGTLPCTVSGFQLAPGTDPLFTGGSDPGPVTIPADGGFSVDVTFTASVSTMPFFHTGNLTFDSSDPANLTGNIALSADVDTACVEASQWIYTVDQSNTMYQFDPTTLTFTTLGTLACPSTSSPFSMAVDQNAVAWVEYADGSLYQVSTASPPACQPTTFAPGQIPPFGMGFVFDPATGADTLYVAGGRTLATIAFPSLALSILGTTSISGLELTGTGDGQLWGFAPPNTLVQIDPNTALTLQQFTYTNVSGGSNWAMKFWGGSFWIFLDSSVYQVVRTNPTTATQVISDAPAIVGAGVSTCAPVGM